MVVLWVVVGLTLRTFGPYFTAAYQLVKKTNEWRLPRFEPKYVLPAAATLGVYIVGVLTIEGAMIKLTGMHPTVIVLSTYAGQDMLREIGRVVSPGEK
jgi:hypothetical protein